MHKDVFADIPARRCARLAVAGLSVMLCLAASGCADTGTTSTAAGNTSPRSSGSADPWAVTDLADYTGGRSGAADSGLSPVKIGWVNQQGGSLEYPNATRGAQAAVKYINEELGGIDGHPLELSTCYVVNSEQEGNSCGLKMANDDDIKAVLVGTLINGGQSMRAVIQGSKPILMSNSISAPDAKGKNVFIFNGNPDSIFGGLATYLDEEVKAKTVAVVYPQDAQSIGGVDVLRKDLNKLGIELKAVGFDPSTTNLTAAAVAAGVQTADAVVPLVSSPPNCISAAKALDSLAVKAPIVSTGSFCFSEAVAQGLGGEAPKWLQLSTQTNVADTSLTDVQAYLKQSEAASLSADAQSDSDATLAWSLVMTAAKFLNEAGGADATTTTVAKAAKSFSGPMLLGSETVKCGSYRDQPGLCGAQSRVFEHTGGNTFSAATDWITPAGL
ncbi:ABC transporter substrate-binding protein [Streptomyces sp. NPDC047072]|uniref:ABC transporter substrate-binding protein n=1 Tax=Streptomyces sp. NPDC047072 TaxID=3154809 RepID=UPI0033C907DE